MNTRIINPQLRFPIGTIFYIVKNGKTHYNVFIIGEMGIPMRVTRIVSELVGLKYSDKSEAMISRHSGGSIRDELRYELGMKIHSDSKSFSVFDML